MATELGVHEVALLRAQRSVPRWDETRARSRVERLERIAVEAAAQCERSDIPVVHLPRSVEQWTASLPSGTAAVVFGARAQGRFTLDQPPEQVWCAVGPEGGFTDEELATFRAAGFEVASLGPTILRVDTAVASGLTVIGEQARTLQAR
jgi:16S rRNA (uracil1498-N3)-methyltransferase